jgi:hypothetical protein
MMQAQAPYGAWRPLVGSSVSPALYAFTVTFGDRFPAAETY